jgi:hypothetical protein
LKKSRLAVLAALFVVSVAPLSAQGGALGAGLWFDVAPLVTLSDRAVYTDSDPVGIDEVARYFARPAILSGGFSIAAGPFDAVMVLELQQDMGEMLKGGEITNLIMNRDLTRLMFSNNYPNVGYLEGKGDWWRVSLGRRAINLGRGSGALLLSGDNPRYDHAEAGLSAPLGNGSLDYDFLAVSVPRTSSAANDGKHLFFHRLGIEYPRFSLGFAEYNLSTGVDLDFQDFAPFLVYHHLFADGSNVMLHLDGEWRPASSFRLYGETLMDDFQLGSEGTGSNPSAFGFSAGAQWRVKDGPRMERPKYFRDDYRLSMVGEPLEGGLVLTIDGYWASTYLYRRNAGSPNQAYFARYFIQADSSWYTANSWFAYPLGPDRIVARANLACDLPGVALSGEARISFLGDEADEWTYTTPADHELNWLGPQDPVTTRWDATLRAEIPVGRLSLATVSGMLEKAEGEDPVFTFTLGFVKRFGTGATP